MVPGTFAAGESPIKKLNLGGTTHSSSGQPPVLTTIPEKCCYLYIWGRIDAGLRSRGLGQPRVEDSGVLNYFTFAGGHLGWGQSPEGAWLPRMG